MENIALIFEIIAVVGFLFFIWPHLRDEEWKKKFVHNKQAFSLIIVFAIIFIFVFGMGYVFDTFFPVERLDR